MLKKSVSFRLRGGNFHVTIPARVFKFEMSRATTLCKRCDSPEARACDWLANSVIRLLASMMGFGLNREACQAAIRF